MLTVLEIIKRTTEFFAGKGIESPRLNAELLIGHTLRLKRMQLYLQFERPLTAAELDQIRPLVRRRGQHEPLQYIVGETEFCGLKVKTDRRALIPRPETEQLVEAIMERLAGAVPERMLDLGTGTGAIALALAKMLPAAQVVAVDKSAAALGLARENAERNGLAERVTWLESDWFAGVPREERFALIVSNPPYLSIRETAEAPADVREHEPADALVAGPDGLDALRIIIREASEHLAAGALLALETGIAQHAELARLISEAGLTDFESRQDLSGRDRFVFARAKA